MSVDQQRSRGFAVLPGWHRGGGLTMCGGGAGGGGLDEMKETSWWGWFSGEEAKPKAKLTEKEQRFRRRSRAFMAFMGELRVLHVLCARSDRAVGVRTPKIQSASPLVMSIDV
ncbi:hypothetical protein CYMTET_8795 [Cymbomonas tetramitiformis]|uniref:Uncharacterized protein n=1 Tax=Cymbomonas tetramitiformis TaxID=36881 RepID=A0AAE0GT09_9CHLO|nr:hypothetical protein CYMTET_8795 [Cymbomonas tetramitiformis]